MIDEAARITSRRARAVANGYTLPCYHGPISILEIGDLVRKRCKCDSVRADKHFAVAVANGKRTALARHNHQIVMPAEDHGEREGASQLRQGKCGGGNWVVACVQLARDQMRDNLGVRFARELRSFGQQLRLQFAEILDDAIVHNRHIVRHMRVRVRFARPAMGRPARMPDAGVSRKRLGTETLPEIAQFSFGAPPLDMAVFQRRHAGRIVAAIFETL